MGVSGHSGVQSVGRGRTATVDAGEEDGAELFAVKLHNSRVEHHGAVEQKSDDVAELDQDAHRLARQALGVKNYVPRPNPIALEQTQKELNAAVSTTARKPPITDRRLSQHAHPGKPPVKANKRVLLGGEPKQTVQYRPQGSLHKPGAVVVS